MPWHDHSSQSLLAFSSRRPLPRAAVALMPATHSTLLKFPHLSISRSLPPVRELILGDVARFGVVGQLSDGTTQSVSAMFDATGGTVTPAGAFTAGQTPGTFHVIATVQGGSNLLADTAVVVISDWC